jgi:hypothetical protein
MERRPIHIGTHYEYPFGGMASRPEWLPQGPADWRQDLAVIKDTGFDSIRIRIGFDSSLDEVSELLDICDELGIGVLFGFATFYVSDQFIEQYPDAKVVDRAGSAYPQEPTDFRWQRVCIDHPIYRSQRNGLIARCAERFGTHPAILDWDVHNEPSVGPGDHPCYCKHTVARYRADLAERFASIAEVNDHWSTGFGDFADIEPPHKANPSPSSFWRDWREFVARNLSSFLLEGAGFIRKLVPGARASFNYTHPFLIEDRGQDWWLLPQLDYASVSHYHGSRETTVATGGTHLSLLKALAPSAEICIAEFQGGPFPILGHSLWRGMHIEAEVNHVFSHGARALYFYRWDPLMAGPEPWINGMVDADDYDTERRLATKRVIADLRKHEQLIGTGHTVPQRVGIYLTREMVWAANGREGSSTPRGTPLALTVYGLYGLFADLGYEVTFVTEPLDETCGLVVLAVPFPLGVSESERRALEAFAAKGGSVIVELPMTGLEDCQVAGDWLKMHCHEWVHPTYFLCSGWSLTNADGKFGGFAFHDRVLVDEFVGQTVAAYRDNGTPAMIASGPGGRLLIPTFPLGRSYFHSLHRGVRDLVKSWLPAALEPDIEIQGVPDEYRSLVEARVVESPQGSLLFVINRSGYEWEIGVTPRGYRPVQIKLPGYGAVRQLIQID